MYISDYYTALADIVPTISTQDPNVAYRGINWARRKICRQTDAGIYIYNFPLVAGVSNYALPSITTGSAPVQSTLQYITEVACYIGVLRYILTRMPAGQIPMLNFQGWPVWYYLLQSQVWYYPIPPAPYPSDLKGRLEPAPLDINNNTLEQVIPEPYQDAVAPLAAEYMAMADGNAEMIAKYEQMYRLELSKIPKLEL